MKFNILKKLEEEIPMKSKYLWPILLMTLFFGLTVSSAFAKEAVMPARVTAYNGKSFKGFEDPEYLSYDQALREYLVKRIDQKFGIALDPKKYSGFDLLEIEALFKCKKSNEPYDIFLRMFPKRR
jgi:hypothetical protein